MGTALNRAIAIGAGVGVAVSLIVWPESASTLVRRAVKRALDACCSILSATITTAADSDDVEKRDDDHRRFSKAISDARSAASSIRVASGDKTEHHRELVDATERLWHALLILERVNERQEGDHLALEAEALGRLREVGDGAGDALATLKDLEPLDDAGRERIGETCDRARDAITGEVASERLSEDQVEQLALLLGVEEVSSNLRGVDDALKALEAA